MSRDEETNLGSIHIADEVVEIVAGVAATEIEGVAGMSGGIGGGIAEMLGRKNLSKGIKVETDEQKATIDLYVIMGYKVRIPDVASQIQENVKRAIEGMTGLMVSAVNVHVQGINFPEEDTREGEDERDGSQHEPGQEAPEVPQENEQDRESS